MAVLGVDNPWWWDVLEHGEASRYAHCFDIDWRPRTEPTLHGKVLLPVLESTYGAALDAGEIGVAVEHGDARGPLVITYRTQRFPINRHSLGLPRDTADALPALRRCAERLSSVDGREELHSLLEAQAYRLAHWRVAAEDINYRRFFDVNSLAALRVENEDVFEATHAVALDLTASGLADGVRIDHPDGLRDPKQYFERLQRGHARRAGLTIGADTQAALPRPLFVVAEKIAAAHEDLPADWALHGTTGYRYANVVTGLFVDQRHEQRFERIWRAASGVTEGYAEIALAARRSAATSALASELTVLARLLTEVAAADRHWRDHGQQTLREAIAEVAAAMPVYRTYVVDAPSAQDLVFIDWAVAGARARSELGDPAVFDMLRACLRLELPADASASTRDAVRRFVWRFQQFCAPVAAKGVEDTAFYRYHRLIALNDVGSDPATFGVSIRAFHGASADRAARWPHTLLATSTHDNKRSEDVRNRLCALSESPARWRLGLRRWRRMTRSLRREVDGRPAPSGRDEVLLYQTLLGTLPSGPLDDAALADYRARIEAYMLKAAREAKLDTSWVQPQPAYEDALTGFVRGLLSRADRNPALDDLRALAGDLAWFGGLNSVAMALIKFASPGVPDLYQGNEIVDLSLVDPDNRRPVDYALRGRWLADMTQLLQSDCGSAPTLQCWAREPTDGRLKLWTIWRLLTLRRECPALFRDGSYVALSAHGEAREHVVAFARQWRGETLIVVAARLVRALTRAPGELPIGDCWGDTTLDLSPLRKGDTAVACVTDLLCGAAPSLRDNASVPLSDLLHTLPVAAIRISETAS